MPTVPRAGIVSSRSEARATCPSPARDQPYLRVRRAATNNPTLSQRVPALPTPRPLRLSSGRFPSSDARRSTSRASRRPAASRCLPMCGGGRCPRRCAASSRCSTGCWARRRTSVCSSSLSGSRTWRTLPSSSAAWAYRCRTSTPCLCQQRCSLGGAAAAKFCSLDPSLAHHVWPAPSLAHHVWPAPSLAHHVWPAPSLDHRSVLYLPFSPLLYPPPHPWHQPTRRCCARRHSR